MEWNLDKPIGEGVWDNISVRTPPPADLRGVGIRFDELSAYVSERLPPFDFVTTGWGSNVKTAIGTAAWGSEGSNFVLFADYDSDRVVTNIWMSPWWLRFEEPDGLADLLGGLPSGKDLFIADRSWMQTVRLRHRVMLLRYLRAHVTRE